MSNNPSETAQERLEKLLAPGADFYRQGLSEWSRSALGDPRRPVLMFGCGALGRHVAASLSGPFRPIAFSDNNPETWGLIIDGIPVLPPEEAVARYGRNTSFIVAIYNGNSARRQLNTLGCSYVVHVRALFHAQPELFSHGGLADPEVIFAEKDQVQAGLKAWADEYSRSEYLDQLGWRLDANTPLPGRHSPVDLRYHEPAIYRPLANEIYVDCGAYDGDSLQDFLNQANGEGVRYIGYEPDPDNFKRLRAYVDSLPPTTRSRITLFNQAVGVVFQSSGFAATATAGSRLSETGDCFVDCTTLDGSLAGIAPTLIKMDVEGNENNVLLGAWETIRQHRPLLVVCLYHRPEDLWLLPLTIKSILPEYALHLRRYAEDCWELVCYAVPPQRKP